MAEDMTERNLPKSTCDVFNNIRDLQSRALKLSACMCLLNGYVPGSFFLKSRCEAFLQTARTVRANRTFEEKMEPFSHLMVGVKPHGSAEQHVRIAHPIAKQGTLSLHDAGLVRSAIAHTLLSELCKEDVTQSLTNFIKNMLTKRKKGNDFSTLISDMTVAENEDECVSVLENAVNTFPLIGEFPQTLSRFYYLECKDYDNAEKWAQTAQEIAPHNSFIADTLGQVYKHHLNSKLRELKFNPNSLPEILGLAEEALNAFEHEEDLADKEPQMRDDLSQESSIYNFRGKCGYLQVANILLKNNNILKLTATNAEEKLNYERLISRLSDEIGKKSKFISMLLRYSEKSLTEKDPPFVLKQVKTCYKNYTSETLPDPLDGEDDFHFLHQNWPKDAQEPRVFDIKEKVRLRKRSYEETKEKYLRSRYLLPLCFLENEGTEVRLQGEVRYYTLYTTVGDEEIELDVDARQRQDLCRSGPVSFHLGFTIKGPTAYDIKYED